jgi:hypothetical protein
MADFAAVVCVHGHHGCFIAFLFLFRAHSTRKHISPARPFLPTKQIEFEADPVKEKKHIKG